MFDLSLFLPSHDDDTTLSVALIDGPTNQKTKRSGSNEGVPFELTIGHQPSNENPGFPTQRSVVRLSTTKVDTETSKPVTAYAQVILSIPKDNFAPADISALMGRLIGFLMGAGASSLSPDSFNPTNSINTVINRLYAGEP
jgi:hypothetical protein